mgnify:CR=1 FL=1
MRSGKNSVVQSVEEEMPDDSLFCPECGVEQIVEKKVEEKEEKYCANCGCRIPEGSSFCPECGSGVEKDKAHVKNTTRKKISVSRNKKEFKNTRRGRKTKRKEIKIN